jgi:Fic family protein
LEKDAFWRRLKEKSIGISNRQKKVINMLLDAFEGKLTTEKWAKLTKSSHDTGLRNIHDLIAKGILKQEERGGRSTAYCLVHTGKQPQV